jgi:EAL domain-containing protein (putative c-di-GMP-specific phosphodiesterase class I)
VHPELSIAVNLSTRDLLDAGLAARIQGLLLAQDVNPKSLRLEITESGLMEDPARSVELLHSLRETGMPLSIDDFGTGYSSLAYLQKLPVNELKIDRSFVDGIDKSPASQRLMKTMIEMGHGLDMMVTAEGIETEAERSTIAALGCDVMQGYLASKPLFGAALQTWYEAL